MNFGPVTVTKPDPWPVVVTDDWRLNEGDIGGRRMVDTTATFQGAGVYLAVPQWWPPERVQTMVARFNQSAGRR